MTVLTQGIQTGEFLASEANGQRSRANVTVTVEDDTALASGTVLGKITATGKYVAYAEAGADDGRRVAAGVLLNALPGVDADYDAVAFVRDCEVIGTMLTGSDANGVVDLAALGVIVR